MHAKTGKLRVTIAIVMFTSLLLGALSSVAAEMPANEFFDRTWQRTDQPVASGQVLRTWMWGPEAFTGALQEPYAEADGEVRTVQYYDKSRMEISHDPNADPNSIWYVTNGLLVKEMITGEMQVSDADFDDRAPAHVNVAGDGEAVDGVTYATLAQVLASEPYAAGSTILATITWSGAIEDDPALAAHNVTAAEYVEATNHSVASPFWAFMTASGMVYENGQYVTGRLFENPYYATGLPITEAYWADVVVGGSPKKALIQCFERRCLTYTPDNAPEWQVEMGNVGRHYFAWRNTSWPGPAPELGDTLYESTMADWVGFDEPEIGSAEVVDGAYQMMLDPLVSYGYRLDEDQYVGTFDDVSVSVDVKMISSSPDSYGCVMSSFNPREEAAYFTRNYEFCIDGYGTASAAYTELSADETEWFRTELVQYTVSAGMHAPSEWNRLTIVDKGDQLWFLVNDDLVGVAAHAGPAPGDVGIYIYNQSEESATWQFRNFEAGTLQ